MVKRDTASGPDATMGGNAARGEPSRFHTHSMIPATSRSFIPGRMRRMASTSPRALISAARLRAAISWSSLITRIRSMAGVASASSTPPSADETDASSCWRSVLGASSPGGA